MACDLHPDYLSTQYAEQMGIPVVRVQHHLAHAFACMADNQLEPPVLAVTWDGSGFAGDGTVWGGDMLHITPRGYRRVACLRPFPLLGNAKAVREPRRAALALLFEIFTDAAFTLDQPAVRAFSAPELAVLAQVLRRRTNSPLTTSAGRLFDAVASLLDLRHLATFEGQAAMELEFALPAHPEDNSYPYAINTDDDHLVLDWEPMVRALIAEAPDNLAHAAARFHNTLVEMATEVAGRVQERNVVLSGGCLQNRYLCERLVSRLRGGKLIAVAPHCPDELRVCRIAFDLAAQPADLIVDAAIKQLAVAPACQIDELVAREHQAGSLDQRQQQAELGRAEHDGDAVVAGKLAAACVQSPAVERKALRTALATLLGQGVRPAHDILYPGEQLAGLNGLVT